MIVSSPYPTIGDLCRMDSSLVERIARGEGLTRLMIMASAVILIGGGLYGFAFGMWRSMTQGLYSGVKLPLLLFAVILATVLINGILAVVLRTRLTIRQSVVCVLLALSISAALLGAFSPVAFFFVSQAPPPLEGIAELAPEDPRFIENFRVAQLVLAFHIVVIAVCGVIGNVRLFRLLEALTGSRAAARRLMFSWLTIDGFVGAQLSWLLRPFLCKPNLEPQMIRPDAFRGNFFEEIWTILFSGAAGSGWIQAVLWMLVALGTMALVVRALLRYSPRQKAWASVTEEGLEVADVTGRLTLVPFHLIALVGTPSGGVFENLRYLDIDLIEEIAFLRRQLRVMANQSGGVERLYELTTDAWARAGVPRKPYR